MNFFVTATFLTNSNAVHALEKPMASTVGVTVEKPFRTQHTLCYTVYRFYTSFCKGCREISVDSIRDNQSHVQSSVTLNKQSVTGLRIHHIRSSKSNSVYNYNFKIYHTTISSSFEFYSKQVGLLGKLL